jgi:hypothetical protein
VQTRIDFVLAGAEDGPDIAAVSPEGGGMLRLRRFALAVFVFALGLIAPRMVDAQNTSQVFGRVTDTSGAVLPGVSVTLSSPALLEPRVAVTGETGTYEFSGCARGSSCSPASTPRSTANWL